MKAFILCCCLVFSFSASAVSYTSAGNTFRSSGGASAYTGSSGSVSGGVASTIESVNVGGRYIGVPAWGPITATAGEVIIGIAQRSPAAIAISVAPWLITKGIEYIDGKWQVKQPDMPMPTTPSDSACGMTAQQCNHMASASYDQYQSSWDSMTATSCVARLKGPTFDFVSMTCAKGPTAKPCPDGYTALGNGYCTSNTPYADAAESDWAKFRGEVPPDQVLNDLCKKLAEGCNVSEVKTSGGFANLSDWVQTTPGGDWTRQVATVTPAPSANDPERVQVSTQTETKPADSPVDPATGKPADNGTSGTKTPDQTTDFCVLHPDSIACSTLGDPPDVPDVQKQDKPLSITPDSGWGPQTGNCPADLTYTTHGGIAVRFSYAPVCQGATTFRPVVIGLAWISAVLIFLGVSRRANG